MIPFTITEFESLIYTCRKSGFEQKNITTSGLKNGCKIYKREHYSYMGHRWHLQRTEYSVNLSVWGDYVDAVKEIKRLGY